MQPVETEYLQKVIEWLPNLLPELALCLVIVLLIFCSLFRSTSPAIYGITLSGVAIHLLLIVINVRTLELNVNSGEMFVVSSFTSIFKGLMSFAALLTVIMSRRNQKMEYYMLIVAILLGADLLVMSQHFIAILLSMELISISSYILTAGTDPDKRRAEAGWKFFIFGSTATAVMIFGMSYLYGATGAAVITNTLTGDVNPTMIIVGGVMTLAGLFFKMTAAPFHLWAPDVYEATPAPIVVYLSVVPKLAALVVVIKLVMGNSTILTTIDWSGVIAAFALLSIIVGTLAALAQTNTKRMMAYSTVAHAGFLLATVASVTAGSNDAIYTVAFYSFVFVVMNYAVFIVINLRENIGGTGLYEDFAGMGYTAVVPALAITVAFVSLTGLPPVAGFTAKLLVFTTLWAKFSASKSFIFAALFVIGLLATVGSLFFYLKIPFYLFFRQPEQKEPLKISLFTNLLLVFLVGLLLAIFFLPSLFDGLGGWVIKVNFGL